MKKNSVFLSILSICFAVGIVLLIIGLLMGGHFLSLNFQPETKKITVSENTVPETASETILTNTADIKKLSFDLSAASITIQTGDSFAITGGEFSKNEVTDGTWNVKNKNRFEINVGIFHFNIPRLSNLFYHENDTEITITIPENAALENAEFDFTGTDIVLEKLNYIDNVKFNLSAGNLTIDSLTADKAEFELSAGNLTIGSLTADKAEFELSAGNIKLKQYTILDSADLDCSLGDITFGTKSHTLENVCHNLKADTSMGNISVFGKLTGETRLNTSAGDIDLKLAGNNANYRIAKSNISMGDISYVTKDFINNTEQADASDDTSLYSSLYLDCSMGNINICYLYTASENM